MVALPQYCSPSFVTSQWFATYSLTVLVLVTVRGWRMLILTIFRSLHLTPPGLGCGWQGGTVEIIHPPSDVVPQCRSLF